MSHKKAAPEQKYEKYEIIFSENFPFLVVKFSVYLNRRVSVMFSCYKIVMIIYQTPCKVVPFSMDPASILLKSVSDHYMLVRSDSYRTHNGPM